MKKDLEDRNMKMTWNILLLVLITFVCQMCFVVPIILTKLKIRGDGHVIPKKFTAAKILLRNVYWLQLGINIFVYAFRIKEIRMAYTDVIKQIFTRRKRRDVVETSLTRLNLQNNLL